MMHSGVLAQRCGNVRPKPEEGRPYEATRLHHAARRRCRGRRARRIARAADHRCVHGAISSGHARNWPHGGFFRCQTAPWKYSYMLGGMVSLCSLAMCLRPISEYTTRSPQMRQCHWSRAKMYGRHSELFGSSFGSNILINPVSELLPRSRRLRCETPSFHGEHGSDLYRHP
jgi:hypothetical protein